MPILSSHIRLAVPADRSRVISTIVLAFAQDPVMRYLFAEPALYLARMPAFTSEFSGVALNSGRCFMHSAGLGVACWQRPGSAPVDPSEALFADTPQERLQAMGATMAVMQSYHPSAPHWYLPQIGVDPVAQGQGLGAALMKAALIEIDAAGAPAFLESSNPRNIGLYERFGFEALAEVRHADAPVMVPMLRPPQ